MEFGIIYKMSDLIGIKYIGYTTQTIDERFNGHKSASKKLKSDKDIWIQHNLENIKMEIIGEYPITELRDMEIYWIQYYRELGCELYNRNSGGGSFLRKYKNCNTGSKKNKKIKSLSVINIHTNEIKTFEKHTDCYKYFNLTWYSIQKLKTGKAVKGWKIHTHTN